MQSEREIRGENGARYRAKNIQEHFVRKYGLEKTQLSKILLSHPLFDIMMKVGPCVSLEVYLKRYFSIIFNIGSMLTLHYFDVDGHHEFSAIDDPFCSLATYAIKVVKDRLLELDLLKPLAKGLKSVGVSRYIDQHIDNVLEQKWLEIDWTGFLAAMSSIRYDHKDKEMENYFETTLGQLSAERSKPLEERDIYSEINMFQMVLVNLRHYMRNGLKTTPPSLEEVKAMKLKKIKKTSLTAEMLEKEDMCVTGKYRDTSREEMEEYAEDSGKFLVFEQKEEKYVAYFVSGIDPFVILGAKWVSLEDLTEIDFVMKNYEKPANKTPKVAKKQVRPSTSVITSQKPQSAASGSGEETVDLAEATFWLKKNISKDINSDPLLIYGGNEEAKKQWDSLSKSFRPKLFSVLEPGYRGKVSDAVEIIKNRLRENLPDCDESVLYQLSVGRFCAAKNIFRICADEIEKTV